MPTTKNRFIKVDGSFERPLAMSGNGAPLMGETSSVPTSPLPQQAPAAEPVPSGPNQYDHFNNLLTDLLKQSQGVSTADLLKRKRELSRATIDTTTASMPSELRTLSPGQQNSVRSGNAAAFRPEIDDNAYQLEKAQQSIDNFFRVADDARKINNDFADKMVAPDSIIENAKKVIEANPGEMSTVLSGFNDKSKERILGGLDYSKLKDTTKKDTSVQTIDGVQSLVDNQTGETIKVLGSKTGSDASALKNNALTSAKELLTKFQAGNGTSAVGGSRIFGLQNIPGTAPKNFEIQFNNLKSLLSLDNVKYLKGQGQVSDAERRLLAEASTRLDLAQSEDEFKSALDDIIQALSGTAEAGPSGGGSDLSPDEIQYLKDKGYNDQQIQDYKASSAPQASADANRPQRNNNPLNIKASAFTKSFPGVAGVDPQPASDGGQFLTFDSPDSGFEAATKLITSSGYKNLTVDDALRRWSGNGYGSEIVPQFKGKKISDLSYDQLHELVGAMAEREGFYA